MIVDANDTEVGVLDIGAGAITRRIGNDLLMISVTPDGFLQRDTVFYHTSPDCTGPRYLPNNGGVFAYFGWYIGTALFYTQLTDAANTPNADEFNSYEVVRPGATPSAMGECTTYPLGLQAAGQVQTVIDPGLSAFIAPFRLK